MQLRNNNNMVRNNTIHCFYNKFGGEEMIYKQGDINLYIAILCVFIMYVIGIAIGEIIYIHISFASMLAIALIALVLRQKRRN